MKFIYFLLCVYPIISNCQQITIGIAGSYGTKLEKGGFNLNAGYLVMENSSLEVGFTKYFEGEKRVGILDLYTTSWILDLEFLYYFLSNKLVSVYVIGGINWTNVNLEVYENGTFMRENDAGSRPGLIYGIGAHFGKHALVPFLETRYQTGQEQWIFNIGAKIRI